MIRIGVRILQIFANRQTGSSSPPQLDFSQPANSGYRGYYF